MARKMKAAVVREFGKPLVIEDVPIPQPGLGQVLVRGRACGVCGTDLHAVRGEWPVTPKPPFIPGHEGVGEVVAAGPGVTHLREGDLVGVPWLFTACGHCTYCWSGWETLCEAQKNTGYSVNGAFAEYVVADADYVGRLPPRVELVQVAPILCAGGDPRQNPSLSPGVTLTCRRLRGSGGSWHTSQTDRSSTGVAFLWRACRRQF